MNAIWWDEDSGQVCISSLSQTFPPRTLVATAVDGLVQVRRRMGGPTLVATEPGQIAHRDGSAFADTGACVAYLNAVFDRLPDTVGAERAIADEDLGGHRVVRVSGPDRVATASCAEPAHAADVLGLTRAACAAGAPAEIASQGIVEEPSWSWPCGPLYLGLDGLLTPTPPSSGFVLRVATALAPTRILLVDDEPYHLAS